MPMVNEMIKTNRFERILQCFSYQDEKTYCSCFTCTHPANWRSIYMEHVLWTISLHEKMQKILTTYHYERISTLLKLKLNLFEKFKLKASYVEFFVFVK